MDVGRLMLESLTIFYAWRGSVGEGTLGRRLDVVMADSRNWRG